MKPDLAVRKTARLLARARMGVMLILGSITLTACLYNPVEEDRAEAFKQYETIVRWSQWDAAADFIAPEYLAEHPISHLDLERLRLFRVTSYVVRSTGVYDEGMTARQTVEIRLFNNAQAVERTIVDEQEWRYNAVSKRWQLHSGLPDPTKRS